MSYDDTNRGQIWPNDKKETDKHPDFKGSLNVEGVEYWVSAWKRRPDANPKAPSLSFSIQRKDAKPEYRERGNAPAPMDDGFADEDIPFN